MIENFQPKRIIILAGPNGAGNTTFARSFLPAEAKLPRFINADLIADADTAVARVALRVEQGGHFIPEANIRRRFANGLHNFNTQYKQAVDDWALYDNTSVKPLLLEWGENS